MSAQPFTDMASRIERLADGEFAGAVVIVPPGGGDAIEYQFAGPRPDLVLFWSSVKSLVEVKTTEAMIAEESRRSASRAFGR